MARRVKAVYSGPSAGAAAVVRFSNGTPRLRTSAAEGGGLEFSFAGGAGEAAAEGHGNGAARLTAESARVRYASVPGSKDCRYLVGAVTGSTLRLLDAEFFEMAPRVKAFEAVETPKRSLASREDVLAAQAQLTESFGGKAKKAKLSAATQYRMDASAIQSSHALAAKRLTPAKAGAAADADTSRLVPPFNKAAEKPAGAYPLDTLVAPSELAALDRMSRQFAVPPGSKGDARLSAWDADAAHSRTVLHAARRLHGGAVGVDADKSRLLTYLDLLIRMYKALKAMPRASKGVFRDKITKELKNPPEAVADKLLSTFTDAVRDSDDKCVYTTRHRDLLTSHIIVAFLHACDFDPVPAKCLATDLGVPASKAAEHFRYVGCTTARAPSGEKGSGTRFRLALPLAFPEKRKRAAPRT